MTYDEELRTRAAYRRLHLRDVAEKCRRNADGLKSDITLLTELGEFAHVAKIATAADALSTVGLSLNEQADAT